MSIPSVIQDLLSNNKKDMDIEQKIVEELLNNNNLESKTELQQPIKFTLLSLVSEYLEKKGLKKSSLILSRFVEISFKYMISKDRKGRSEYIQALQTLRDNQKEKIDNNPINMEIRK